MSFGSLPLLAVFVLLIFIFPFLVWKAFHDHAFPLAIERLPLYREFRQFYIWFLLSFIVPIGFFSLSNYTYDTKFYALLLFPSNIPHEGLGDLIEGEIATKPNVVFLVFLYAQSAFFGYHHGGINLKRLKKHLDRSRDLYQSSFTELVGFWGALLKSSPKRIPVVTLNIFTKSGVLYEGRLFDYAVKDSCLANVALKDVERFIVEDIKEVHGDKNERRYSIPGDVVYFEGADISNVNVKSITYRDPVIKSTLVNEAIFRITEEEFKKWLEEGMIKRINVQKQPSSTDLDKKS